MCSTLQLLTVLYSKLQGKKTVLLTLLLLQDCRHLRPEQEGRPGVVPERPGQEQEIYQQVKGTTSEPLQVVQDTDFDIFVKSSFLLLSILIQCLFQ